MGIGDRIKNAWNAFVNRDPTQEFKGDFMTYGNSRRPDRPRLSRGNERSIATSVFNRISLDAAAINISHVKLDQNGRFLSYVDSGLNNCLTLEANKDQTSKAFIQDIVLSLMDEGCVAVVPVDTVGNPNITNTYDILSMRTGKITEWYPDHVRVDLYNDQKGIIENIRLPKRNIAIIENPLYAVVNETNSTLQRLMRKLVLLDSVDNQSSSGKLDMIIQLPYTIKSEARRREADRRKKDLESQLEGSKFGIGYIDATEKITQLNRSLENNLMSQIEYLTSMLYSQLGITTEVLDGTANESTMLNYYNRTVGPIVAAIVNEMKRKFLTKTARTQGQSITYMRDPFELLTLTNLSEIGDSFIRNEILSANEIRQGIGIKPNDDPKSDELRNPNMPQPAEAQANPQMDKELESTNAMNDALSSLEQEIDSIIQNVSGGETSE